ncbi:MAG: redoxin domain-containing protein [Verrucomicrobia bacterium]|nr:redoxin domain-containing protein [Verrucomicrobiota bacterium]
MKTPLQFLSMLAALSLVSAGLARASVAIGQPAPDFTLTDINGASHTLSAYKGKTVVLEWVNPECPFVIKHYGSGNMPKLQKEATGDGVVWLSINSGRPGAQGDYDAAQVAAWLKRTGAAPTAYCRDQDGKVGRMYEAKTTPHMFVITAEGTLVYEGAIDSIRSTKIEDLAKATNYVRAALASVKAGKPVEKAASQPYGCSVKY